VNEPIIVLTELERIAKIETDVKHLAEQNKMIIEKLEALLAFKHKGLGALSLVTAILGTSILGAVYTVIEWIKSSH
jgi:hypothetical protein